MVTAQTGFTGFFVHPYTWTYKLWLYITVVWAHNLYTVALCPLTKLATRLLAHLGELQCPSCFNGDCAHVELRPSRVYTQSDPLTNTVREVDARVGTSFDGCGRTVHKMISWPTAKSEATRRNISKVDDFYCVNHRNKKQTKKHPPSKPNRAGYKVGNSIAKSIAQLEGAFRDYQRLDKNNEWEYNFHKQGCNSGETHLISL